MTRLSWIPLTLLLVAGCEPDVPATGGTSSPDAAIPPAPPSTSPTELAERLPASINGRDRQSLDQSTDAALGAEVTHVSAGYGDPAAVTLDITDYGTAEMTKMMGHGWALAPDADRLAGLPVQRDSAATTARVLVGDRMLVQATAPTLAEAERALRTVRLELP